MFVFAVIDPLFVWLNLAEAVLWCIVAVVVAWRWRMWPLAGVLVAFGVSDVVETTTGAWYRPWWLLLWKGVCVVTVVVLLWRVRTALRSSNGQEHG